MDQIENESYFNMHPGYTDNITIITKGWKVFMIATRDIQKGEELFFHYSFGYWKHFYDLYKEYIKGG